MADERDLAPMVPLTQPMQTWIDRVNTIFDAITNRAIADEPTYHCWVCLDTGYIHRERDDRFGANCTVARPCEGSPQVRCTRGTAIEAGIWADWMQPKRGKNRSSNLNPPPHIVESYRVRLRNHPHGNYLRESVDRILAKPSEEKP